MQEIRRESLVTTEELLLFDIRELMRELISKLGSIPEQDNKVTKNKKFTKNKKG
jgi:hypothetical protein